MKKCVILFLITAGVMNGEDEQRSCYKDYKLMQKLMFTVIKSPEKRNMTKLNEQLNESQYALDVAMSKCEATGIEGWCDQDEEFNLLFAKYIASCKAVDKAIDARNALSEHKQIKKIIAKH
jgi:hypothetical protein